MHYFAVLIHVLDYNEIGFVDFYKKYLNSWLSNQIVKKEMIKYCGRYFLIEMQDQVECNALHSK